MAHEGQALASAWISEELMAVIDATAELAQISRSQLIRHSIASTLVAIAAEVNTADDGAPPRLDVGDG
jgi:hypothetical protein